ASYLTRTLYQETLFFLLPFYAYSTVVQSANVVYVVVLAGLAVLSCLDLVFDHLLRERPTFALIFFATVAFSALNLVLPMLWPVDPRVATWIALGAAVVTAVPLSLHRREGSSSVYPVIAVLVMLGVVGFVPGLVPPVPLRLDDAVFSTTFDRESLEPGEPLGPASETPEDAEVIFLVLDIFAPSSVPASVSVEWTRSGVPIRSSRDIEITAHEAGFRIWDAWRSPSGSIPPGRYVVTVRTTDRRVFGRSELVLR
ncbi:MAG: DUF5924 family protein, partial [Acidobacteriota bacterium]|nr:DUF5924 family protein [Acidobacteriota bacterium]